MLEHSSSSTYLKRMPNLIVLVLKLLFVLHLTHFVFSQMEFCNCFSLIGMIVFSVAVLGLYHPLISQVLSSVFLIPFLIEIISFFFYMICICFLLIAICNRNNCNFNKYFWIIRPFYFLLTLI